ncbi:MAG TPA: septal ring lytic transglycosylase RlpA family protein [Acidobacteriaceae bacterium]
MAASIMIVATGASSQDLAPSAKSPIKSTSAPSPQIKKQRHWYQVGQASWYGTRFDGKSTANGEVFDSNALTCAHRELPLGSWLRVTNLRNHKSVVVRVNDRGPLEDDRIVDLSQQAASTIDIYGLGRVRLELVSTEDRAKSMITKIASLQVPALLPRVR